MDGQLNAERRSAALDAMSDHEGVDVLVIGGGVTGAGIALDAATRGLRTAVVEMQDWSSGTSSRSSKLVHGGLRYLYQLDFPLVAEALRERSRLLTTIAPHLVRAQPFLWPLRTPVIERAYSAVGVGMYDLLARLGSRGRRKVPMQKHYSKKGALRLFPQMRPDSLTGAIRFYDARVDDSRLVIGLIRTAVAHGALAASRTQVTSLTKGPAGEITGAVLADLETGEERTVRARHVINATGVWTEETETLSDSAAGLEVLASKGAHIVVPKDRIRGETGLFLRTEKSVLFVIPWDRYWIIGTTDTPWTSGRLHPVATAEDIDYILDHANEVLTPALTRDDIIGVWAGLRPLLQPGVKGDGEVASTKVSREHTVVQPVPGLTVIAGGKLTTYREMAVDAVDMALGSRAKSMPSITADLPLVGAEGFTALQARASRLAAERGWTRERMEHLMFRYGTEVSLLLESIDADPSLGEPLPEAEDYLKAEVAFAVTHEGALHLQDIIDHRVRIVTERRDRGIPVLPAIAETVAPLLGWDRERIDKEIAAATERAEAEMSAESARSDAEAEKARLAAKDLIAIRPLASDG